jgi:hypothetical protein
MHHYTNREKGDYMTGIIEQMAADIAAIKMMLSNGQSQPQPVQPQRQQPPLAAEQMAIDPFAMTAPVQQPVQRQVTSGEINALIMPHIQNQAVKEALSGELQAMGIDRLPNARPDQLAEIYQRFEQVIARFAALNSGSQPQAATGII